MAAWLKCQQGGVSATEALREALRAHGLGQEWVARDSPGFALLLGFLDRGVVPEQLGRELLRAVPGLAAEAARPLWAVLGSFVDGGSPGQQGWPDSDDYDEVRAWRELPGNRRKLSHVRHHFDLVLRWFNPRVDRVALEFQFDTEASDLLEACRWRSSPNRRGWGEMYCWLGPESDPSRAQVMVWSRRVGWVDVPGRVHDELKKLQQKSVFADGSLFMEQPPGTGSELLIFLPHVS